LTHQQIGNCVGLQLGIDPVARQYVSLVWLEMKERFGITDANAKTESAKEASREAQLLWRKVTYRAKRADVVPRSLVSFAAKTERCQEGSGPGGSGDEAEKAYEGALSGEPSLGVFRDEGWKGARKPASLGDGGIGHRHTKRKRG
jgi:hypothetical protein